uniref:Uncharacterized protein n=1 Tax=Tanacetum cinerariifolium TaxID=118510 RepID=A0A699GM49_TANCI|nr:hypothetical protein [Tanacetum cinerariifolium]
MSEFRQTNQFSKAISSILGIVDNYLASKMKDAVDVVVQLQTNKLREEAQAKNQEFLNQVDSTMKTIIKEQVDDQDKDKDLSAGSNRGSKKRRSGKKAESSKEPTHKESKLTSSSKDASRSQPNSSGKSAHAEEHGQKALDADESQWNPSSSPTPDCTCKSVVELEYHLEEVFKATKDRLDWNNPEGKPYPHDLSKPLPLIQNEHGHQVIPWDYFINNDLEYLKGRRSSQKYTTNITKTKAADYGQVKDKKFYGYASNTESSYDVYSRHKIIIVSSLNSMMWFGYSHPEEIIVRRQDDKLYKFREGDFKRLQRQDIEDMLLLLIQDKLFNLNLEERYALNVALRMFTQRIVIQERVENLQLGVKSYQKINLKRPDTYRLDLRRMTPYTAYPDIQGIIYEDEMNRNHLMRTDELHKFSDGLLDHVRTVLNDISTGIEMDYLPKRKWSKQDKKIARVMINAIDRKLRDRRLMRNLEKFLGGRPYEGDLRLLERTI